LCLFALHTPYGGKNAPKKEKKIKKEKHTEQFFLSHFFNFSANDFFYPPLSLRSVFIFYFLNTEKIRVRQQSKHRRKPHKFAF